MRSIIMSRKKYTKEFKLNTSNIQRNLGVLTPMEYHEIFYCIVKKVAACHKKSLKKVDGFLRNSIEKVCTFVYFRDNGKIGKNHAEKED